MKFHLIYQGKNILRHSGCPHDVTFLSHFIKKISVVSNVNIPAVFTQPCVIFFSKNDFQNTGAY